MSAGDHDLQRLERHAAGELGGSDRDELLRHVDGCAECRSWLEIYQLLAQGLAGEISVAGHPSSEQLARYCVEPDSLTEPERGRIAEHLINCRECAREHSLTSSAVDEARRGPKVLAFAPKPPARWRPLFQDLAAAAVLLAASLGFTLSQIEWPDPAVQRLAGGHLSGIEVVRAVESITATSTTIESGGDVTFRAGETVVLGEGFSIGENVSFRVEIVKAAADPSAEPALSPSQSRRKVEHEPVVRTS